MRVNMLYIIGAPRCGTTALAEALSRTEAFEVLPLKEPGYLLPRELRHPVVDSRSYERLLRRVRLGKWGIDATPFYYAFEESLLALNALDGEASVLFLVRRPRNWLLSWHAHCLRCGIAVHSDLEVAWKCSAEQEEEVSTFLHMHQSYKVLGRFSRAVRRMRALLKERRVGILTLDDIAEDPEKVWAEIGRLTGVEIAQVGEISRVNERAIGWPSPIARALWMAKCSWDRVIAETGWGANRGLWRRMSRRSGRIRKGRLAERVWRAGKLGDEIEKWVQEEEGELRNLLGVELRR